MNLPPMDFWLACRRLHVLPTRWIVVVSVPRQEMQVFRRGNPAGHSNGSAGDPCHPTLVQRVKISTSKFGVGQHANSYRTPLGLHRVKSKIGDGWPVGTIFKGRKPEGLTWRGVSGGSIAHRILWLEGLEEGWNKGGDQDTFARYIYIHGFTDETTIGRPASHGCVHVRAIDLIPFFDRTPLNSLVWITNAVG